MRYTIAIRMILWARAAINCLLLLRAAISNRYVRICRRYGCGPLVCGDWRRWKIRWHRARAAINLHFVVFVVGARPEIRNCTPNEIFSVDCTTKSRRAHTDQCGNDATDATDATLGRPFSQALNANKDIRLLAADFRSLHRTTIIIIIKMILFVPSNKNNNK